MGRLKTVTKLLSNSTKNDINIIEKTIILKFEFFVGRTSGKLSIHYTVCLVKILLHPEMNKIILYLDDTKCSY